MSSLLPGTRFTLPDELHAPSPPEARGVARDQVRLLVAQGERVDHARFAGLGDFLDPGDLLVVNTSATLPAAVDGVRETTGDPVVVHVSTTLDSGERVVELRTSPDAAQPILDAAAGERVGVGPGALTLLAPYPTGNRRLWRAAGTAGLARHLARTGRPIRYGYVAGRWPLEAYQTVFATEPGSAEMPSAGRPFTPALVTELVNRGVLLAPVTLHTGVSSQEAGEPPLPERFRVPAATAQLVNWTRERGHRVVAVGTTVVRAVESAADHGALRPAEGWTDLVIGPSETTHSGQRVVSKGPLGPQRPVQVVDSLLTGLHAPDASHLLMLETIAGPDVVRRVYHAALRHRYLWHEFGDLSLLLSDREGAGR